MTSGLGRTDFIWALQYACDLAMQVGDIEAADEMARITTDSDEELKRAFDLVQYLSLGLEVRKIRLGRPSIPS